MDLNSANWPAPPTILAVNDLPEQLRFLGYLLGDAGYRVIVAEDGCEGLEIAQRERPDLILSDVNMPKMDGITLCRKLRADEDLSKTPFLLMSSEMRDTPSALEGLQAGADDYLELPYDNQRLVAKVKLLIDQRRSEEALLFTNDALLITAEERALELQLANQALREEIAERRRAEKSLRESEERYRQLLEAATSGIEEVRQQKELLQKIFDHIPVMIVVVDDGGRVRFVNRAWEETSGWNERDCVRLGMDVLEELHPNPALCAEVRDFIQAASGEWGDFPMRIRDGSTIDTCWANVRLSDGTFIGIGQNISARKSAEAALEQSETRFQLISRATNDAVWDWELGTGKVWWNESIQTLFGYTSEDVGDDATWWYEHIHPEDVDRIVSNVDAAIENNWNYYSGEYRFQRKDGTYAPTLERGYVISDDKGNPVRILGSMMDLTEFKKSEEALRQSQVELRRQLDFTSAITASFGDGLYALDAAGRLTFMNRAAETILGYKSQDWIGHNMHDRLHANLPGTTCVVETCPLWSVLTSGQTIKKEEDSFTNRDGAVISVSCISSPIITFGEISGAVISFRDSTERRALETQLRHAQKLESIGQLAAGIAHEINTPIQYVGDNIRFIEDGFQSHTRVLSKYDELSSACKANKPTADLLVELDEVIADADVEYLAVEMPKAIHQSLDGIQRIGKIVQSMKDFAHPGSAEKHSVDLNRAIESTITVARNEWKYVAELEMQLDAELPNVPCHLGEFNQVILNLIVNASHAIADVVGNTGGKGTITLSTRRVADWVEISVSDTGAGIPEAIRPRVFDPFFTTKTVGKGTGQGLAISHNVIVEKHGGSISFDSKEGAGTTFTIRIPLFEELGNASKQETT
jgi:two-component system NtrC family sensor kinase